MLLVQVPLQLLRPFKLCMVLTWKASSLLEENSHRNKENIPFYLCRTLGITRCFFVTGRCNIILLRELAFKPWANKVNVKTKRK